MASDVLATEIAFYNKNKAKFLEVYRDKFLLIKGEELVGSFDSPAHAYEAGVGRFGNQAFLIQQVLEREPIASIPVLTLGLLDART